MRKSHPEYKRVKIYLFFLILVTAGTGALLYFFYYPGRSGPEQPIAFSHRLHTNEKNISCVFCHEGAIDSDRAGIPPMETCLLCHDHIIIHHPEIENLRTQFASNVPLEWQKVYNLPDLTYFSHSVHLFRKIDCAECHGDVKQMDRVFRVQEFKMEFCIQCHRDKNATTDCFTCHR